VSQPPKPGSGPQPVMSESVRLFLRVWAVNSVGARTQKRAKHRKCAGRDRRAQALLRAVAAQVFDGMPMTLTISPGSSSTWRGVGSIWPAALHSSNKFPTSTRPAERACVVPCLNQPTIPRVDRVAAPTLSPPRAGRQSSRPVHSRAVLVLKARLQSARACQSRLRHDGPSRRRRRASHGWFVRAN
jgi:hypothetical protein